MVLGYAFAANVLVEGLDERLIHYSDADRPCGNVLGRADRAAIRLCRVVYPVGIPAILAAGTLVTNLTTVWRGNPALTERLSGHVNLVYPELGNPVVTGDTGSALELGQGAVLRVLAAGEHGAILELKWEEFHALLPVGQDVDTLATLLANRRLAHAEVLLLAECGWAELNLPEWIGKLQPQMVLLSVGRAMSRAGPTRRC